MPENNEVEVLPPDTTVAGAVVPRAQIQLPASIRAQLQTEVADIQKRIGAPASNRIKVTQKKTFRMPTGEESPGPIEAVVVDFVSANYFYTGVYDPDDIMPPECFALGTEVASMTPHTQVAPDKKQADACAICPQNQFGTAQRGRGKACNNCRVLALLPPDATDETPLMTMRVSPTALRAFDAYVASIARSFGAPPYAVVTKIGFDPAPDYPSLRFGEPTPVSEALFEIVNARREEARQLLLTPPDTTSLKVEVVKKPVGGARRARA